MKKITLLAIVALILLIFINPSKIGTFNNLGSNTNSLEEIGTIDFKGEIQYVEHKNRLCLLNDNKLKIIDEEGKEIHTQEIQSENTKIYSNSYIDILSKNTNKGFSMDENGKVVFSTKVSPETFLYESINQHVFVDIFKGSDKETLKILNNDGEVNNRVEVDGKITNIKTMDNYILMSYISITNKIQNKLALYDENGNVKQETEFNDIILDVLKIDGNIYIVFEDNIKILDKELSEKNSIKIEGVSLIEQNDENNIFIKDSQGNWGYIKDEKYKGIKTKEVNLNLEGIKDTYLLYTDKTIYNDSQKQIINFNEEIKDIEAIGKNSIAVVFENKIKIYKIL